MGFSGEEIRTLLESFRDEFKDKTGRLNVGSLKKEDIDSRIKQFVTRNYRISFRDLAELLRQNMNNPIDNSGDPFIETFGVEVFEPDNWERQMTPEEMAKYYNNINDPDFKDTLQDLIDMTIKNRLK